MDPLLSLPIILSFFITLIVLPSWIKRARKAGLTGKNMNQYEKGEIAEVGGIIVIMGFIIGVLCYVALKTFYFKDTENSVYIFALLSSVLMVAFIGMMDDILGWKIGLGKKLRLILIFISAIPLMVINAGDSRIIIPLIDGTNLGLIYPLLIIPLGFVGATATYNFLAGFNGLEAGQGVIIIAGMSIVAWFMGNTWITLIGLCMIAALFAFLFFNIFPARVLPGDSLTYPIGALIAIFAILGNFEKVAVFFFIPYIAETFLKLRGKLQKQSFGKPQEDGSLDMPYEKIYGLEHFSIWSLKKIKKNGKVYEKDVVRFIHLIQIIFVVVGIILFKKSIF